MQYDIFDRDFLDRQREDWRKTIEGDGGYCPCCDKWGKISPQGFTEVMALGLLWFAKQPIDETGWINVPKTAPRWMLQGKTFTTMQHWELIEKCPYRNDETKKSDGLWKITQKGLWFVSGTLLIPKKVYIYRNFVEAWSDEMIDFKDCFGKRFDYEQVMSDSFNLNAVRSEQ